MAELFDVLVSVSFDVTLAEPVSVPISAGYHREGHGGRGALGQRAQAGHDTRSLEIDGPRRSDRPRAGDVARAAAQWAGDRDCRGWGRTVVGDDDRVGQIVADLYRLRGGRELGDRQVDGGVDRGRGLRGVVAEVGVRFVAHDVGCVDQRRVGHGRQRRLNGDDIRNRGSGGQADGVERDRSREVWRRARRRRDEDHAGGRGRVSVTTTPVAGDGPLLVAVTV